MVGGTVSVLPSSASKMRLLQVLLYADHVTCSWSVRLLGRFATVGAFSISAHMDLTKVSSQTHTHTRTHTHTHTHTRTHTHTHTLHTLVLRDQKVVIVRGMERTKE